MSKPMVNVWYLEDKDFKPDGSLSEECVRTGGGKPWVVMAQGDFCGYCTQAKPAFQSLSNNPNMVCGTIDIAKVKNSSKLLSTWDPSYRGVPAYMGFSKNGRFRGVHGGDRSAEALARFAQSLQ
jgi:hypothetical protein